MENSDCVSEGLDFPTVLASSLHDMKNALSIVLGMLEEVIGETPREDPRFERLLKVRYEGQRIGTDMAQLLGLYRGSTAQLSPRIAEVEVADFLTEQMLVHEVMLAHKGIQVEVVCDASLVWFFDRELVAGILTNVINNAYKYTRSQLRVSGALCDEGLVLSIQDDGPGYPPHMLANDQDGLPPVDFRSGSTGLGLYFAKLVARVHRNKGKIGHVRVTNDGIDGGGCFCLWLP